MHFRIVLSCTLLFSAVLVSAQAPDFQVRDYLKRTWTNERIFFPLTPAQRAHVKAGHALEGPEGPVSYQLGAGDRLYLLTDLAPFETRAFRFTNDRAKPESDLKVEETADAIRISNGLTGILLAKRLTDGGGPIQGVRLQSGKWAGGSADCRLYRGGGCPRTRVGGGALPGDVGGRRRLGAARAAGCSRAGCAIR